MRLCIFTSPKKQHRLRHLCLYPDTQNQFRLLMTNDRWTKNTTPRRQFFEAGNQIYGFPSFKWIAFLATSWVTLTGLAAKLPQMHNIAQNTKNIPNYIRLSNFGIHNFVVIIESFGLASLGTTRSWLHDLSNFVVAIRFFFIVIFICAIIHLKRGKQFPNDMENYVCLRILWLSL